MKHLLFFLLIAMSFSVYSQVRNYNINDVVSNFTVTDTHGNSHTLYDYTAAGKYVFIDFFFTTCGPCQGVSPIFNQFYDKYGCNSGNVICLSIDRGNSDAEVISYENAYGGSYHHAPAISGTQGNGNAVNTNFGVNSYPTLCLIDPQNRILNLDIFPCRSVADLEHTFPSSFNPPQLSCTSSVDEYSHKIDFDIYHNSLDSNILNVRLISTDKARLTIYDMFGKEVFATNLYAKNSLLNIDLKRGVYFARINTKNSSQIKKLIL